MRKLPFVLVMLALVAVVLLGASCLYATQPGDEMTFSVTTLNVYANTFTIAADCSPPDAIALPANATYLLTWSTTNTSTAASINPTATTMSNDFRQMMAPARSLGNVAPPIVTMCSTSGDEEESGGNPREVAYVYIGNVPAAADASVMVAASPPRSTGTDVFMSTVYTMFTGQTETGSPGKVAYVYIGNVFARESDGFSTMPATRSLRC